MKSDRLTEYHHKLSRLLAHIDQLIAEAESVASDPEDECRQSALDFMAELREVLEHVEGALRGECT
jgi:hypothetical protein